MVWYWGCTPGKTLETVALDVFCHVTLGRFLPFFVPNPNTERAKLELSSNPNDLWI